MKKILIIIVVAVSLALLIAFGSIYLILNKVNEPTEEEKLLAAQEELDKIDYEQLKSLSLDPMTIQIKQTLSKPHFLMIKVVINVKDEKMLARVETLKDAITDSINGIFENKTAEELQGKREEMKEPILEAVRELFTKEEDKIQVVNVLITDYKVSQ